MKLIFTFSFLCLIAFSTKAQSPFTVGNIVVLRVGDGTNALKNTGNAVFLDEYNPTTNTLVQSLALPTTTSGANNPLIISGTAGSEGALTRSANGQFLALAGYATTLGGTVSLSTTAGTAVKRVIGIVKNDASINTSRAFATYASASNPRGAYTNDGNSVWMVSSVKGVQYNNTSFIPADSTSIISHATSTGTNIVNFRVVNELNGQLFVSTGSGSAVRIGAVGTGLPTDTGKVITAVPGLPISNPSSPYAFWAAKVPSSFPISNVLYVADDNTVGVGGIKKYALNIATSSWDSVGVIDFGKVYRGITGVVNAITGAVTLYATRNSDSLVSIVDNALYNAPPSSSTYTLIAAAPAGTAFKGVALTPEPALSNNIFALTARLENNVSKLSWSMEDANGINNFIIEKSINGKDFYVLNETKANQNKNYSNIDNQFNSTTSFYRIKAIQTNGSTLFSNTVVVAANTKNTGISIYPNPAKDFIVVNHPKLNTDATLRIVSAAGETLLTQQAPKQSVSSYISISNLPKGSYSVVIYQSDNSVITKQFMK